MDPLTMMAIAQGVVGGAGAIYNLFAGGSQLSAKRDSALLQLNQQKQQLLTQQKVLGNQMGESLLQGSQLSYDKTLAGLTNKSDLDQISTERLNADENINTAVGKLAGNMAQSGIVGPEAADVATSTTQAQQQRSDERIGAQETIQGIRYAGQVSQFGTQMNQLGLREASIGDELEQNRYNQSVVDQEIKNVNDSYDSAKNGLFGNALLGLAGVGLSTASSILKSQKVTSTPAPSWQTSPDPFSDPYKLGGSQFGPMNPGDYLSFAYSPKSNFLF